MSIRSGKDLTTLDFDSIKANFKAYLKSQKIFQDFDFEGSNINVLLDTLAYNTSLNAFYLNMISNEMFLDSALLRDSIVSHAKELNYLPRSFRSAQARVRVTFSGSAEDGLILPRDTTFTGTLGNRNFSFVTTENISLAGENNTLIADNVTLYEGNYTSDTYVVDPTTPARYQITNKTVDTNSITVTVLEDNGETTLPYFRSETLFGLDSGSRVYFIQPSSNESYEIVFGDGVIGRPPSDRSLVIIQYRVCNGELPNGIHTFVSNDTTINGMTVRSVDTIEPARGGSIPESLSSIKLNAPRAFTTQERAVTSKDYETLLTSNFSEINAVSAYGGEESVPPQFGKVIVAVDLKTTDELPPSRTREYFNFLRPRSPLAIEPVFVSPDYTYVRVSTHVKYNINQTPLSSEDMRSIVTSTIQNFNTTFLNGFNKTLHYSKLVSEIDFAQLSIVSNDTEVVAVKTFTPAIQEDGNYVIDFGMEFANDITPIGPIRDPNKRTVISSSPFFFSGARATLEDDGVGNMRIMVPSTNQQRPGQQKVRDIGTVDYNTGVITLERFRPQLLVDGQLALYAHAFERDITARRRTILSIRDQDITVSIEQVRL